MCDRNVLTEDTASNLNTRPAMSAPSTISNSSVPYSSITRNDAYILYCYLGRGRGREREGERESGREREREGRREKEKRRERKRKR